MIVFWSILMKAVTGLVIGFSIGMTGIGGGILVLPALVILFGMSPTMAVGTANLYAFLTKIYAAYHHWQQKTIAVRICTCFLAGAVPATLVVAYTINWYVGTLTSDPVAQSDMQDGLKQFIGALILVTAVFILWDFNVKRKQKEETTTALQTAMQRNDYRQITVAITLGAMVGGLIAATSVGGGVVLIPLLIIVFGLSPVLTVGSSIFIGSILTFLSSAVYATGDQLDWTTGVIMAAGAFVGVPLGTRMSKKIKGMTLQFI
ncbi:uncharacterized protein METZ01_LOCUS366806, partial [marine metagenome]